MKSISIFLSVAISLAVLTLFGASPIWAQDKGKDAKAAPAATAAPAPAAPARKLNPGAKLLFENAKVWVVEFRIKPGITAPSVERGDRVIHDVQGGTLLLTYPDGKTVERVIKAGNTRWVEKATFGFKNVGKTEVVQIVVFPK